MGRRILGVFLAAVVPALLFCGPALADGGLFGKDGRDISEPEQKAVVFFHEGTEELVLSVRYEGAAEDFAWLVPTPEPPQVEESDIDLFWIMSEVTPSTTDLWKGQHLSDSMGNTMEAGVEVIDELTVGAFDLTVLRADDAGDLRSWLEERGFAYDEEAEEVLAEYVERGWCFTAMRISPSYEDPMYTDYELSQGTINPLRFSFSASQPVYPLRISSLNPGSTEVLLYVLGPQAYGHESMKLEYAESWQPVQIAALKDFSELAGELEGEGSCCLTKLRQVFRPDDMEDLYLTPVDEGELAQWSGAASTAGGGGSAPWWALLAIALLLAVLMGTTYGLSSKREEGWLKKTAAVFLIVALIGSAILLPLGIWILPADEEEEAAGQQAEWPWEEDILVAQNGWSKAVHPDGWMEIQGMDERLLRMIDPPQVSYEETDPSLLSSGGELDGEGRWEWGVRHYRADTWQTRYLVVTDRESGEVREVDIGEKEVHDARLSPEGDRLWVAMNPGVPVNKTEAQEYAFPSLELVRSIIHDDCLSMGGGIVLSAQGEPLLAGRFDSWTENQEDWDTYLGFLPMFEENAAYVGNPYVISWDEVRSEEDMRAMPITQGYFCDATDASLFLLVDGYDYETGDGLVFVLDASDGSIYEVCEGTPVGWE